MPSIPRRTILKSAGVLGTVLLAPKLPLWSLAEAAPSRRAPDNFAAMSSTLMGVPFRSLQPIIEQDNIPMSDVYYNLCMIAGPAATTALLAQYDQFVGFGLNAQTIANFLLTTGGVPPRPNLDSNGTFSRLSLLAWLYGVWYGGTEIARNPAAAAYITDPDYHQDFLVSGRAYKNGWIWRIAQSHPMGFSQFNFGTWATDAPTLRQYGVTA
jgi:hypothetical protein